MEVRPGILRTPDARFEGLTGYGGALTDVLLRLLRANRHR
jgi:hypothetical protein